MPIRKGPATVAKRDRAQYGTDYLTKNGMVILTDTIDGLTSARITLVHRPINVVDIEPLFALES